MLQNRQKVDSVLKENKDNLEVFVQVLDFLKENKLTINDLILKIDLVNDIKKLKSEKDDLEFGIQFLKKSRDYIILEYKKAKKEIINFKKYYN